MTTTDRWEQVPRLLADNSSCVLATADEHGTPWATPVYFAAGGDPTLGNVVDRRLEIEPPEPPA